MLHPGRWSALQLDISIDEEYFGVIVKFVDRYVPIAETNGKEGARWLRSVRGLVAGVERRMKMRFMRPYGEQSLALALPLST